MLKLVQTANLEKKMRPGALSQGGFLGVDENLDPLLAADARTLQNHGVTASQLADALEMILSDAKTQRLARPYNYHWKKEGGFRLALKEPQSIPRFTLENLPSTESGYLIENLHVFIVQYRGCQECPWGCSVDAGWASFDFLILNRLTGETFTGPALAVHLIREHGFFEGKQSPYRVAPEVALRVLSRQCPHQEVARILRSDQKAVDDNG